MEKLSLKTPVNTIGQVLKRDQMKKILGGYGGLCDSWATKPSQVCYNCCITVHSLQYCGDQCYK